MQDAIISGKDSNCWIAKNSATSSPYGLVGDPSGTTFAVHRLVVVNDVMWTILSIYGVLEVVHDVC